MGLNGPVPANAEAAFLAWSLALPAGADARAAARLALAALPSAGGADLLRLRGYLATAARTGAAMPRGRRRRRSAN
ncbi:hypothetical protein HNP73_001202 [Amaricoccus macauensis]|uniref:Uncharacterized protein n=1 Tax=Amaricoccus macauensis TaxID=57001 RepID=A0A840SPR6_9RHOB|nr:hypothetical protein [Amaricoccus macauensis]MBB5221281.1 hypothetical protein [Amaricoccus macauensis]